MTVIGYLVQSRVKETRLHVLQGRRRYLIDRQRRLLIVWNADCCEAYEDYWRLMCDAVHYGRSVHSVPQKSDASGFLIPKKEVT